MTDEEFQKLLDASGPDTPQGTPASPTPTAPQDTGIGIADLIRGTPNTGTNSDPAVANGGADTQPFDVPAATPNLNPGDPGFVPGEEKGLGDPTGLDAVVGGGLKSIFETGDFLFGETSKKDRTAFRNSVEDTVAMRSEQSMVDGFAAGISQFAVGMIGLGKLVKGGALISSGKAAVVGAVSFDPYESRLSNLIQETWAANFVTEYLSAKPEDSAAEGRLKAAIESIGLDATIGVVLLGATTAFKYFRAGDIAKGNKALDALSAEAQAHATGTPPVPPEAPTGNTALGAKGAPSIFRVDSLTQAAAADGVTPKGQALRSPKPKVKVGIENTEALVKSTIEDVNAISEHGGWSQAIDAGHTFGKGEKVPYRYLNSDAGVEDFVARVVDTTKEQLDKIKGGDVLGDTKARAQMLARLRLWGVDPETFVGVIQQAGADARNLRANFEGGMTVATKLFHDAYALSTRIGMGDYVEFGNREEALKALEARTALAASVYGHSKSIISNTGRALRSAAFAVDQSLVAKMKDVGGDRLVDMFKATEGNLGNMRKIANPSLLHKAVDYAQHLFVNNLVSGPITHVVNIVGSSLVVGTRPLATMIGGTLSGNVGLIKQGARQYAYTGSSLMSGFKQAVDAFLKNDSVLHPHRVEQFAVSGRVPVLAKGVKPSPKEVADNIRMGKPNPDAPVGRVSFKPMTSTANILYNALLAGTTIVGLPTRSLGAVDELMKQTVYRAHVHAKAHVEAVAEAVALGLKGKDQKAFVEGFVGKALNTAFDDKGRALDSSSLYEAQAATFQQDLLQGTLGRDIQGFAGKHPGLRFILPFVKTPTNLLRYGWKLTPGLNLLQAEYRSEVSGALGAERRAQALGQSALGALFMGSASFLVGQGRITGGGPRDPKALKELLATGWRPYSFVWENEDGSKTYIQFGRLDPGAIPIGIVADIHDAINAVGDGGENSPTVKEALSALGLATIKQFANKQYLQGVQQVLEVLSSDDSNKVASYFGNQAANLVPFSAFTRQVNQDEHMREARTVADKMMANTPGLSETLPARYDWLGEPIRRRVGLWSSTEEQVVNLEVQRLLVGAGSVLSGPSPRLAGVDLRDLTMSTGENAYEKLQQLSGKPSENTPSLRSVVSTLMQSEGYQRAPDGDVSTPGTKLWLLHISQAKYHKAAMDILKTDPKVQEAFLDPKMRVAKAYNDMRGIKTKDLPKRETKGSLKTLGEAFGIDLSPSSPTSQ